MEQSRIEIIDIMPFCIMSDGTLGIAEKGTFAAQAWCLSDEAFNGVMGTKFSWIAPDGGSYTDDRDLFNRPTKEQIIAKLSGRLLEKATEMGIARLM